MGNSEPYQAFIRLSTVDKDNYPKPGFFRSCYRWLLPRHKQEEFRLEDQTQYQDKLNVACATLVGEKNEENIQINAAFEKLEEGLNEALSIMKDNLKDAVYYRNTFLTRVNRN